MAKTTKTESKAVKPAFKYMCPACTNEAIVTTNKMLGVEVDCSTCNKRIQLDDPKRYIKL